MKLDSLFKEVEENLEISRSVFQKKTLDDEADNLRSLLEAKYILKFLKDFCNYTQEFIKNAPSLETLIEKEFGTFKSITSRDNLISTCFVEEYLIPEANEFPIPFGQQIDPLLLDNYPASYKDWCTGIFNAHKNSQEQIFSESFTLELKQSQLGCQCQKCIADYRARLRDIVFNQQKELIDKAAENLEEAILERDIAYVSDSVSKLKRNIERNLGRVRYKLKRGSLNKLDSQIKDYFKLSFGHTSDLSLIYRQRLIAFFNGLLDEEGHHPDLITDNEYDRFFSQLGVGLWKAPHVLKREFLKLVKSILAFKRKDISATILKDYLGQFWIHSDARKKKRKVIYHMGPTNSGKTYNAIEALSQAKNGCYLAPLRLLASELFDTLNDKGCQTTLLTGEEVVEVEGATHFSSTIEMAKLHDEFECVVIDEIQMITDPQRGWAWTRALVNMNADEIHLCGDHSVYELVEQILKLTGDELEVHNYERKTKLSVMDKKIRLVDMDKNDTLIVFSRRNALKYKRDLENLGFKVSIVYGRLSPEVRREQARKFDEGETDIMVATDAIAMGMNLPIKRIVFSAISKFFDGKEYPLTYSELKQIAGRAGRYKRFPEGYVTTLAKVEEGLETISAALHHDLDQKELAMVGPDLEIFRSVNLALEENNLQTLSLSEFLRLFNTMSFEKPFYCVELKEMIELAEMVEDADTMNSLSDAEIFGFACAPVNQGLMEHVQYYVWILNHYVGKNMIVNEEIDTENEDIDYLETAIKCVELYQWLARHFDNNYFSFDIEKLNENKSMAIEKLNQLLSEKISKKCSSCGCKLPDDHQYNICETCFAERRSHRGRPRNTKNKEGRGDKRKSSGGGRSSGKGPNKGSGKFNKDRNFKGKKKSKGKKNKSKADAFKRG